MHILGKEGVSKIQMEKVTYFSKMHLYHTNIYRNKISRFSSRIFPESDSWHNLFRLPISEGNQYAGISL
jgi:hypothetical protein